MGQTPDVLTVEIADITFKFLIDNPCINNDIKEKYVHFLVEKDHDILVETRITTEFMGGDNFLPDIRRENQWSLIERPDFHARYDQKTRTCSLKLKDSIYSFESFCRIFLSDYLLRHNGFLLHATALIRKGKGYIFTGASGSGKSTIGALSPDNILLSDEIIIVRKIGDRYRVYGTPFISKFMTGGVNEGVDVEKLFYLNKSPKNFTEKISEKAALSKFLGNTVFFSRSKMDNMQIFLNCSDFISSVPCFELYFKPENSVWPVIEEA